MDHDDVLEEIELAAVEPGGLARLMAGDTPVAAAVVGHLAGCERCAEELRRMSRAAPLLRDVVRTTPPADLRDRTLAYVREYGRPRGDEAGVAAARCSGGVGRCHPPAPAVPGMARCRGCGHRAHRRFGRVHRGPRGRRSVRQCRECARSRQRGDPRHQRRPRVAPGRARVDRWRIDDRHAPVLT